MTESEMLLRMSSKELTRWKAYFEVEPFGPAEDEYRMAKIISFIAEMYRNEKNRKEPYTPEDFMRESFKSVFNFAEQNNTSKEESTKMLIKKGSLIFGLPIPGVK